MVEKKLKEAGIEPTDKPIGNAVLAEVSGTKYRIIDSIQDFLAIWQTLDFLDKDIPRIDYKQLFYELHTIESQNKASSEKLFRQLSELIASYKVETGSSTRTSTDDELASYYGKYVALEDNKIVGSGNTSADALSQARSENPERKVKIKYVSDSDIGL